ncbi:MAG: precorrin-4 C(11)-methyltransferase [Eubacterium sp.]|nr:precorrin-4 C(11)-methyltransferase [Eubacterium sp.]
MVHFVGAGPGAKDLITVRGSRLLQEADVVIYAGSLVNPELLSLCRKEAELYDSSRMTLPEIISVMEKACSEGKNTVRLHSGEPSLYGAVREQMDQLDRKGIAYDSCPGVTAAFGAASVLNMEYTLPGVSQSLILTRMSGRTPVPADESIESFAAHHCSMAVYLSGGMLPELARRLAVGGLSGDTPVAIIYKATWPDEKRVHTTISGMAEEAAKAGIDRTAIVLVGDAVIGSGYHHSSLYDPGFETGFRKAKEESE